MKRRSFINLILGAGGVLCASNAKPVDEYAGMGYEPLNTKFTGCSSQPLDGEGGNYERFFKRVNGFDINNHQRKWMNEYYSSQIADIPVGRVFLGKRQTGMTTFAWTTMMYAAIYYKGKICVLTTQREAYNMLSTIKNNAELTKRLTKYSMRSNKTPAFTRFDSGGGIYFFYKHDLNDDHSICGHVFDQIWKNEDMVFKRGCAPSSLYAAHVNKPIYYYGT
jgi:hypothetical protein